MRHTYADPWEDPLARVWGVLERDLGLIVRSALLDELSDLTSMEGMTVMPTYSYHISITLMQALEVSMQIAPGADICYPQLRCFSNCWSWVLCKWVEW